MKKIQNLAITVLMICIISQYCAFAMERISAHWAFVYAQEMIEPGILNNVQVISYLEEAVGYREFLEIAGKNLDYEFSAEPEGKVFISREEACNILAQGIKSEQTEKLSFLDYWDISGNMCYGLEKLKYHKIIDGYPDGNFYPQKNITRAEVLKLLHRIKEMNLYNNFGNASNVDTKQLSSEKPEEQEQIENESVENESMENEQTDKPVEKKSSVANRVVKVPIKKITVESGGVINPAETSETDKEMDKETDTETDTETDKENSREDKFNNTTTEKPEMEIIAASAYPYIDFTAVMGSRFRSVDVFVNVADDRDAAQIYYLALEAGSTKPDINAIVNYSNNEMLQSGKAVRGKWTANKEAESRGLTLYGGENIDSKPKDLGFMDGYNYDIYMVAQDSDGNYSEIASVSRVMAMPFYAAHQLEKTFTIKSLSIYEINKKYPDLAAVGTKNTNGFFKTARQLENIQRLADLYQETDGIHGNPSFLTDSDNTYILADDIDLEQYKGQNFETGWKPIGNADENPNYIFSGSFEGNNKTISNLYIDRNVELYNENIGYQGLFGRTEQAIIRNLNLQSPVILAKSAAVSSTDYSGIGALIGESSNSIIENVTVNSPRVEAYSAGENNRCAIGGLVGSGINTSFSKININSAQITNNDLNDDKNGYADVVGGVVGRFYNYSGGVRAFNNIFVSGWLKSNGKALGGIAGTIDSVGGNTVMIYSQGINSTAHLNGRAMYAGGIAGNIGFEHSLAPKTVITFDNCYASGVIRGIYAAGGLFGKINASDKDGMIVKNSASEADIISISETASMGGFVGIANTGSFESCTSVGSGITSAGENTGGFAGEATGNTDFIRCMTNRNVQGKETVGGFVGSVQGTAYFESSSARGSHVVAETSNAGGFAGTQSNGYALFNNCTATAKVYGENNVGNFIGEMLHGNQSNSEPK